GTGGIGTLTPAALGTARYWKPRAGRRNIVPPPGSFFDGAFVQPVRLPVSLQYSGLGDFQRLQGYNRTGTGSDVRFPNSFKSNESERSNHEGWITEGCGVCGDLAAGGLHGFG